MTTNEKAAPDCSRDTAQMNYNTPPDSNYPRMLEASFRLPLVCKRCGTRATAIMKNWVPGTRHVLIWRACAACVSLATSGPDGLAEIERWVLDNHPILLALAPAGGTA